MAGDTADARGVPAARRVLAERLQPGARRSSSARPRQTRWRNRRPMLRRGRENPAAGGYIQNRNDDGTWPPFDPASSERLRRRQPRAVHLDGAVQPRAGCSTRWAATNARNAAAGRLLPQPDGSWALTRSGGLHAELDNEPSIGSPWLYIFSGQPYKAQETCASPEHALDGHARRHPRQRRPRRDVVLVRLDRARAVPGDPRPRGALGHAPLFPRAVIRRANGKTITIDAPGASSANAVCSGLMVDGARRRVPGCLKPSRATAAHCPSRSLRRRMCRGARPRPTPRPRSTASAREVIGDAPRKSYRNFARRLTGIVAGRSIRPSSSLRDSRYSCSRAG